MVQSVAFTIKSTAWAQPINCNKIITILSSQVVSLPFQSVMEVANFCAAMDTLIDQDGLLLDPCDVHMIAYKNQVTTSQLKRTNFKVAQRSQKLFCWHISCMAMHTPVDVRNKEAVRVMFGMELGTRLFNTICRCRIQWAWFQNALLSFWPCNCSVCSMESAKWAAERTFGYKSKKSCFNPNRRELNLLRLVSEWLVEFLTLYYSFCSVECSA